MKKAIITLSVVAAAAVISINAVRVDKDPLHGRTFEVQSTEYKDGSPKTGAKPIKDEIFFKGGKLYSDLAASEKMGEFSSMIKYEIEKDSTYSVDDEEKHFYVIKASTEKDGAYLEMVINIDDIDIEGSMKLSKKDKLKKHFEFVGKEKASKKKKK